MVFTIDYSFHRVVVSQWTSSIKTQEKNAQMSNCLIGSISVMYGVIIIQLTAGLILHRRDNKIEKACTFPATNHLFVVREYSVMMTRHSTEGENSRSTIYWYLICSFQVFHICSRCTPSASIQTTTNTISI
jgi:hypothetical protein